MSDAALRMPVSVRDSSLSEEKAQHEKQASSKPVSENAGRLASRQYLKLNCAA